MTPQAAGAASKSAAAHARFAKAVLLVYLGASSIAVALFVAALVTDRNYDQEQTEQRLQLETEVRASYLGQHMALLVAELQRLGLRSEVNLLDANMAPERRLLEIAHSNSTFFNLGVAVVDLEGTVQWAEPRKFLKPGTSLANQPWFLDTQKSVEARIVPVDPDATDAVVFVVSPVVRDGEFTGALVGGVDLTRDRPMGQNNDTRMTVLATARGSVVYPPVPPHFAVTAEWMSLFSRHDRNAFTEDVPLDEVSELPERSQAKLLKFLDSMRFRRVGGEREIEVELRVVAATNQDIARMVADGRFRADLYYRLGVFTIAVPALAERREDIPALADRFLHFFAGRVKKRVTGLTPGARRLLLGYDYPGNVRELCNIIERAVILARGSELTEQDLVLPGTSLVRPVPEAFFAVTLDAQGTPPSAEHVEHEYVRRVLDHCGGRRMQAAQALGLSYPTFLRRLRELGLD